MGAWGASHNIHRDQILSVHDAESRNFETTSTAESRIKKFVLSIAQYGELLIFNVFITISYAFPTMTVFIKSYPPAPVVNDPNPGMRLKRHHLNTC